MRFEKEIKIKIQNINIQRILGLDGAILKFCIICFHFIRHFIFRKEQIEFYTAVHLAIYATHENVTKTPSESYRIHFGFLCTTTTIADSPGLFRLVMVSWIFVVFP